MRHPTIPLWQTLCLAMVGSGLAAAPAITATAAPAAHAAPARSDREVAKELRSDADGKVLIAHSRATGKATFVRVTHNGDLVPGERGSSRKDAEAKADAFLARYAGMFGVQQGSLHRSSIEESRSGTTVTYTQKHQGIPVYAGVLRAHVDRDGDLSSVNGEVVPIGDMSAETRLSETQAADRAVAAVTDDPPRGEHGRAKVGDAEAVSTTLEWYKEGLVRGIRGGHVELVYQVEVTNRQNIRDMVFVSAYTGKIVNRYSMLHTELHRTLYEADADRNLTQVWTEGDPMPGSLNKDQESMVRSTGDAYWFFKNAFGRDSYDGAGHEMITINNDPLIRCPNANWNGRTTNYCDGVAADDVVAHEWGHAYTEHTDDLIYQWQPGALNESYSDIWGETVDLINGRLDEGESNIDTPRPVGLCSAYTRGEIGATINAPADIAGPCEAAAAASFGPIIDQTGVTSDVVVGRDSRKDTGHSETDGCSEFTNADAISGRFVYVDRGTCTFATKAAHAQQAGAEGIVVGNNVDGAPIPMSGTANIYGLMVTRADGERIKSANGTVNLTVKDIGTADKADSNRWLMGEKARAFGGAIRDMWNPTCYGDPGKVSDAEYHCATTDGGGVHSNSGVPNHGYALLVDGGTVNGVTVEGIGLDKAAAIYYEAMVAYQTPASDFVDHANSLEAACASLTGRAINKLSTNPDDAQRLHERITSDDCAQVHAMTQAVELRLDPTGACDFKPLLAKNPPAICGPDYTTHEVYAEDFESGLGDWTTTGDNPNGGDTWPWAASAELPGGREGSAAYGADPNEGDCSGTKTDASSVDYLTSGDVEVAADTTARSGRAKAKLVPKLSFQHYVATEPGWDGGTVQISVNGRDFATVPADAYTFNAPGTLASEDDGSTNPLAGTTGFTGTDGGKVTGSWGESQIDLAKAGVKVGDTIVLRFAMGRDGCSGIDGWYVDDVTVTLCQEKAEATVTATHDPQPAERGSAQSVEATVTGPGAEATGTVKVKDGDELLGRARLDAGSATVPLPTDLTVGVHRLTLVYSGDDAYKSARVTVKVRVVKRIGHLVAVTPAQPHRGRAG